MDTEASIVLNQNVRLKVLSFAMVFILSLAKKHIDSLKFVTFTFYLDLFSNNITMFEVQSRKNYDKLNKKYCFQQVQHMKVRNLTVRDGGVSFPCTSISQKSMGRDQEGRSERPSLLHPRK